MTFDEITNSEYFSDECLKDFELTEINWKQKVIYAVRRKTDAKVMYVGQTFVGKLHERFEEHFEHKFKKNKTFPTHFDFIYAKYAHLFFVDIIYITDENEDSDELRKEADHLENFFIRVFNCVSEGYNANYGFYKMPDFELAICAKQYPFGDWSNESGETPKLPEMNCLFKDLKDLEKAEEIE